MQNDKATKNKILDEDWLINQLALLLVNQTEIAHFDNSGANFSNNEEGAPELSNTKT